MEESEAFSSEFEDVNHGSSVKFELSDTYFKAQKCKERQILQRISDERNPEIKTILLVKVHIKTEPHIAEAKCKKEQTDVSSKCSLNPDCDSKTENSRAIQIRSMKLN
uniref:Uncharacterized protein n=1 Tax=Glossina pallidipes TaxID=7398 RepID=A0A1A9Z511_GLOPL